MITIMTGTNDIKHNVAEEDFMVAYSQLITKVRLLSQNITLIKIPAFSKGIMYPYNYGMNGTIHKFNGHIEALAIKHSIRYLEFCWREEWLYDGVHLNECGSKNIGVQLANYILKDKGFGTDDECI